MLMFAENRCLKPSRFNDDSYHLSPFGPFRALFECYGHRFMMSPFLHWRRNVILANHMLCAKDDAHDQSKCIRSHPKNLTIEDHHSHHSQHHEQNRPQTNQAFRCISTQSQSHVVSEPHPQRGRGRRPKEGHQPIQA